MNNKIIRTFIVELGQVSKKTRGSGPGALKLYRQDWGEYKTNKSHFRKVLQNFVIELGKVSNETFGGSHGPRQESFTMPYPAPWEH